MLKSHLHAEAHMSSGPAKDRLLTSSSAARQNLKP